ncbi:MAG: BatD family protein [Methylococcales bacterium]|nr:BatD family protein [Methylococcales bacterium]
MNTIKQLLKSTLFFLLLALVLPTQSASAAKITVSVDRNPVGIDESFQILFTTTESPDAIPDFDPLEQDFTILNQEQSNHSSWVNGKSSKTIQWTLNVIAKNAGSLTIPAIEFGHDRSEPLTVEVIKAGNNKSVHSDEDLFLDVEATPADPYLQSQVIYTLRLYRNSETVNITQAQLAEPELADAVIAKMDEDHNYTANVKGVNYSIIERKYVIFPQKSGKMTIKPLVLTAEVMSNARPSFNGLFNSTQTKRVVSKEITLDVKPVPASFTGTHWLSAEQLEIKQEWSGDFEQMKVGEPLTRTLSLQAKGATVSSLPELNAVKADDHLKTYPDQPVLKEQKSADGLLALREEKIALIPSKIGSYTLPAIKIPWFNTKTNKTEIATIPETTITVAAGAASATVSSNVTKPQADNSTLIIQSPTEQAVSYWFWVSLFLALGWLITLFYFLTNRPAPRPVVENTEAELSLKASINQLKKACADNNAIAAKNALLAWGTLKFSVTSLGAIADCCDARLHDEILQLNQVLYAKDAPAWSGKKLFQAFVENKARAKMPVIGNEGLEPLFRL